MRCLLLFSVLLCLALAAVAPLRHSHRRRCAKKAEEERSAQPVVCGETESGLSLLGGVPLLRSQREIVKAFLCAVESTFPEGAFDDPKAQNFMPNVPVPSTVPSAETFTREWGLFLVNLQLLSANAKHDLEPTTMPGVEFVRLVGSRAGLFRFGDNVHALSIVGTDSLLDVGIDLAYAPMNFSRSGGGKVHTGFNLLASFMWGALSREVNAASAGDKWVISGHSLGASTATILAAIMKERRPDLDVSLVTLASPRVGDYEFLSLVKNLIPNRWHIVNLNDLVPNLPLSSMPFIAGDGTVQTANFTTFLERTVQGVVQKASIPENHFTPTYACLLEAQYCDFIFEDSPLVPLVHRQPYAVITTASN